MLSWEFNPSTYVWIKKLRIGPLIGEFSISLDFPFSRTNFLNFSAAALKLGLSSSSPNWSNSRACSGSCVGYGKTRQWRFLKTSENHIKMMFNLSKKLCVKIFLKTKIGKYYLHSLTTEKKKCSKKYYFVSIEKGKSQIKYRVYLY